MDYLLFARHSKHSRLLQLAVITGTLTLSLSAWAQETASVLPKGFFRARSVTVMGLPIDTSFNDNGDRVSLMEKLNKTIPASTQANANPQLKPLYDSLNQVEAGLGDKLFQTDIIAAGSLSFQKYTTALEYGIRDNLTLGLIVPVVHVGLNPKTSIAVTTQSQAIIDKLEAAGGGGIYQPIIDGIKQFEASKPTAATYEKALFTDLGYSLPGPVSVTGLGDIELGAKWQMLKQDRFMLSFIGGFRFPTSTHIADPTNILDRPTGDKQYDVGAQTIANYEPIANTLFGTSLKYTWQLADSRRLPVPSFNQMGLTNLTKEDNWDIVHRDLGDLFDAELSVTQYFKNRSLYGYGLYGYGFKGTDSMSGSKNLNYAALTTDSQQISHKYEFGMGYSTIPAFRAKKFAIPMEVKVAFNGTLKGKNVSDASYTRFDVYLFF